MAHDEAHDNPERQQESEGSSASQPSNTKVKQENMKKENECKRKLSEVSPPKVRKILHNIMSKYYNDPFYEMNDIAKKILKRLRVNNSPYFMTRIKKNMEKWISDNVIDKDSDEDSSDDSNNKESKDVLKEDKKIPTKTTEKKDKPSNANMVLESEPAGDNSVLPDDDHFKEKNKAVNKIVKVKKAIPIIDLTLDLKEKVKKEIITIIDEDIHDDSNEVINTPVNGAPIQPIQQIPYPAVIQGYNPVMPVFYPSELYQSFYPNYNQNLYNAYGFMPYGYPYNPYSYSLSDFLPNYPVDENGNNNAELINDAIESQSHSTERNVDTGGSQTVEGSDSRQ